jgi:hypothetical protein
MFLIMFCNDISPSFSEDLHGFNFISEKIVLCQFQIIIEYSPNAVFLRLIQHQLRSVESGVNIYFLDLQDHMNEEANLDVSINLETYMNWLIIRCIFVSLLEF